MTASEVETQRKVDSWRVRLRCPGCGKMRWLTSGGHYISCPNGCCKLEHLCTKEWGFVKKHFPELLA